MPLEDPVSRWFAPAIVAFTAVVAGCGFAPRVPLPAEQTAPVDEAAYELLARFAQISDAQIIDEESPARLTGFDDLFTSAWRPQEAYSTQILDGTIRAINRIHAGGTRIDFVLHTGDATDNVQANELDWFVTCMNGGPVDPRSGPDDRSPEDRPPPELDPHAPFVAQGVYRQGNHGPLPTIRWFSVVGNHDRFALGVFPIVRDAIGRLMSPLPLRPRIGLFWPVILDPTSGWAWQPISPAHPEPTTGLHLPVPIEANPNRRYVTIGDWVDAHRVTGTGGGFPSGDPSRTWYAVSPKPGLRLIVLDSTTPLTIHVGAPYSEGAISPAQLWFLSRELERSNSSGEVVILATHHPADSLVPLLGTSLTASSLVDLLHRYDRVALHLAGHWHEHAALDRNGYVELVTGSLLDPPQQGRIVELWRDRQSRRIELRYRFFSHLDPVGVLDEGHAGLGEDPLRGQREIASRIARSGHFD